MHFKTFQLYLKICPLEFWKKKSNYKHIELSKSQHSNFRYKFSIAPSLRVCLVELLLLLILCDKNDSMTESDSHRLSKINYVGKMWLCDRHELRDAILASSLLVFFK
jgi:hypothetical protein